MFKAHAGQHIEGAYGQIDGSVGRGDKVVALIVVAHFGVVDEVEPLVAIVGRCEQLCGQVEILETSGQGVARRMPLVDEAACVVLARAVLGIASGQEFGLYVLRFVKSVAVIDGGRGYMLIETGELAVDVVAS